MTDDDPPLSRVRRAKSHQSATRRVDGGAVAVGMVVALGAHLVPASLSLLDSSGLLVRTTALASTGALPVGCYVTGRYAGGDRARGGLHGVLTAAASLALLGFGSVVLTGSDRALAEFGRVLGVGGETTLLAGSVVCLLFAGIAAGAFGAD
ncbi:hypothetical protein [Haladaptatus sp. NG-WS-4]